jgi:hypothetical protein
MANLIAIAGPHSHALRALEGHRVSLTLLDGSRMDDVTIVSGGRGGVSSVWLDVGGMDVFMHRSEIVAAEERQSPTAA